MKNIQSDFTLIEIHKTHIERMISAVQFKLDTYQHFFATDETDEERTETEEEWKELLVLFHDLISSIGFEREYQHKPLRDTYETYVNRYEKRYDAIYLGF